MEDLYMLCTKYDKKNYWQMNMNTITSAGASKENKDSGLLCK